MKILKSILLIVVCVYWGGGVVYAGNLRHYTYSPVQQWEKYKSLSTTKIGEKITYKFYQNVNDDDIFKNAHSFITSYIENHPEDWEGYVEMVRWNLIIGNSSIEENLPLLEKAGELIDGTYKIEFWKGYLYGLNGMKEEAYQALEKSAGLVDHNSIGDPLRLLVETAYIFGDYEKAAEYYDTAYSHLENSKNLIPILEYYVDTALKGEVETELLTYVLAGKICDHLLMSNLVLNYNIAAGKSDHMIEALPHWIITCEKRGNSGFVSKLGYLQMKKSDYRNAYTILASDLEDSNAWPLKMIAGSRVGESSFLFKKYLKQKYTFDYVYNNNKFSPGIYSPWVSALVFEYEGMKDQAEEKYKEAILVEPFNVSKEPEKWGVFQDLELEKFRTIASRAEEKLDSVETDCPGEEVLNGSFYFKYDGKNNLLNILRYVVSEKESNECKFYNYYSTANEPVVDVNIDDYRLYDLNEGEVAYEVFVEKKFPVFHFYPEVKYEYHVDTK